MDEGNFYSLGICKIILTSTLCLKFRMNMENAIGNYIEK